MKELTQEQIQHYNKEIAIFEGWISTKSEAAGKIFPSIEYWKSPNGNVSYFYPDYQNWDSIMKIYQKLCQKVNHQFCVIEGDRIWSDGKIDLSFQQALFYVVGKTCEQYNKNNLNLNK